MAEPIKMPDLGSGMEEGTLLNWTKQVGDTISDGEVIAEIETDKATVEVPVNVSGTIIELIGEPGQTLKVGAVIGYVGEAGEKSGGSAEPETKAEPEQAPKKEAEQAVPVQGDGAASAAAARNGSAKQEAPERAEPVEQGGYPDGVKASPVARKIAAEKGIDLKQVQGTGPGGRIVKADVESFTPSAAPVQEAEPAVPAASALPAPTYRELPSGPDVEIIETTRLRSRIASRMVESKQQVPHFYVTAQVDVDALLALRKQINEELDDEHKVSVNDLVVKAAALTLRDFPNLNTHFYGDKLVRHKRIHIGIAVALPNGGLMNVVARDADRTAISALAAANKAMIQRAREGKVKPEDVQGSTFTVSNLGAYDVEHFIAIINPPEAGILAIGTASKVPVVKADGELGIATRMKVTISADHRVSDGAEGAQFLQRFKALIENPMRLLI
ncbi:MAG: dihydrolipoamide acetyltransferase family protein [Aggregatilineales bacterium]